MRRFPSSWTDTLSKLRLKIRRRPAKGRNAMRPNGYGRRMSLEQLESRQLLTGTPWEGVELAVADFDGDGNLDRLRTTAGSLSPETWVIDSKTSAAAGTVETWKVTRDNGVPASAMPAVNEVLVGDFNGDGRDDLMSKLGSGIWYVILSRSSITPTPYSGEFAVLTSWNAPAAVGGWITPIVGDFNGDGRDDLAAFDATNPTDKKWQVALSSGTSFKSVQTWVTQSALVPDANSIRTGDFNGDGRADLLFKKSGTSNWAIAASDGSRFNVFDSSTSTTWTSKLIGDFDGDGADELLGWSSVAGRWETVRYNDHRGMSLGTSWGSHLGSIVTSTNLQIGDANRDQRDDLVVFDTLENKWKVALSQQTAPGTNSFVHTAAASDGTNDWDRWFKEWDWGSSNAPYKFLNIDAPYQKFLDIFSDVYNNVELELYPGLMKGIEATAQTKAGNDWDQAALLVDRLEAAGFDADIAYGTVRANGERVAKWIGTTNVAGAHKVIQGTLDAAALLLAEDRVRFKHAWVRAIVPTAAGFVTVDVDPSWKFKERRPGEVVDLTGKAYGYTPLAGKSSRGTFDEFGYLRHAGTNQLPVEWYEDQVMKYLVDEDRNRSLADVAFDGPVLTQQLSTIPASLGTDVTIDSTVESYPNLGYILNNTALKDRFVHQATISIEREIDNSTRSTVVELPANTQLNHDDPQGAKYIDLSELPWTQYDMFPGASYSSYQPQSMDYIPFKRDFNPDGSGLLFDLYGGERYFAVQIPGGYQITPYTAVRFDLTGTLDNTNGPELMYFGLDTNLIYETGGTNGRTYFGNVSATNATLSHSFEYNDVPTNTQYLVFGGKRTGTLRFANVILYEGRSYGTNATWTFTGSEGLYLHQGQTNYSSLNFADPGLDVTANTLLEVEFKAGVLGQLHGIGWDVDSIAGNDAGQPSAMYKLAGTSNTFSGYSTNYSVVASTDGYSKYIIPIGSTVGTGASAVLRRLRFHTDNLPNGVSGTGSYFRNIKMFEPDVGVGGDHWSYTLSIPEHSLSTINIDYVKTKNAAATSLDDIYRPRLLVDGNIVDQGTSTEVFQTGDDAKVRILHLSPSEFGIESLASSADKTYTRKAGEKLAIGFDANQYSTEHIVGLQAGLNAAIADGVTSADIDKLLSYTSAKYWYELNRSHQTIDGLLHTVGSEQWVGSGIVAADPYLLTESIPDLNGGVPVYTAADLKHLQFPILPYNMGVDLPNTNHVSYNVATGTANDEAFQLGGFNASALENAILEDVVNSRSVSTIRGIANSLNDSSSTTGTWVFESVWDLSTSSRKIYRRGLITEDASTTTYEPTGGTEYTAAELRNNANAGLKSLHTDEVVARIVTLLDNAGSNEPVVLLVPNQKSAVGSWSGSVYVAEFKDSAGSHGAYIIDPDDGPTASGGRIGNSRKPENIVLPPATFVKHAYAGDPVNVANGNMFRDEVDFTFANPVIPLDFARHYDTQNKQDVGFGVGWVHAFTGIVYEEVDQVNSGDNDYVWLRGSGERHTFETLDFTLPNTLFGDVETTGSGANKRLSAFQDRSGTQYFFEPVANPDSFVDAGVGKKVFGRLVAITDSTGLQGVTISYDDTPAEKSVRVKEVRSLSTPSRYLQFVYGANGVEVKRLDGGQVVSTWAYTLATHASYLGKRLTQVKHANQASTVTNYLYYTDGPASRRGLIQKIIEPNLESHSYEYYANGRVFRVTDGAGKQQSFNYNLFRNLTEFTDENGNVETYIHQDNGLLLRQIHNDRSRLEYIWGPQSTKNVVQWEEFLMQSSTDERGAKEWFDYYDFVPTNASQRPGELRDSISKDGTTTTFTYKQHDYISSVVSTTETPSSGAELQTAEFTYDEYGHILTAKDATGHITKYEYFDATAPAHLRGLRKSETRPKGVSNQSLAAGETYEAVPWKILDSAFNITGNTISVELRTPVNGQPLVADAIRIDRMDKDGVFTQVIDSSATASSRFRLGASGGTDQTGSGDAYGGSFIRIGAAATEQTGATWIFRDLEPGTYRVSAAWQSNLSNGVAKYLLHKGLPDGTSEATIANVSHATAPADFRSYQTLFEYDSAGNLTRSITEGLPAGRRAYDRLGNLIYEEDAKGVAKTYAYDVLNHLVQSDVVQAKAISFINAQVFTYFNNDADPANWATEAGGATLYMFGKNRIAVPLNHEITPNTILEFDFEAPSTPFAGEWYDVSFINAINQPHALTFKLGGTDPNSLGTRLEFNNYVHGSGPKHFRIPIGQQYGATQLSGTGKYVVFTNFDHINNGPDRGQSRISNVRIYEAAGTGVVVGTTKNSYDESGRLTSTTDALGNRTAYLYNLAGRLAKTVFPDSTFKTHEYDAFGNCVATTDELGRTTRYVYDDRNRLIQTIYADGNSTRMHYNGAGSIVSSFDELGTQSRFTYYKAGRLLTSTMAVGLAEEAKIVNKYDSRGRRIESVDAVGVVTKYRYDNLDRLVQTTVLDKSHTSPNDTTVTPVTTSKLPVHVSTIEYDSQGNVLRTAIFDPRKFAVVPPQVADYSLIHYDATALINPTNETENKVQVVRFAYDAFGRATKVTNADGTSTSTIYDAAGRARFAFDELGRKTEHRYDLFGRLEKTIFPNPGTDSVVSRHIRYVRDAKGQVTSEFEFVGPGYGGDSVTDETENWFKYDTRGRMTRRRDRYDAMLTDFVFDPAGQLVSTTSPEGSVTYSRFDERGSVLSTRLTDPDGSGPQFAPVTTNEYDEAGNLETTFDPLGNKSWFVYDPLNRLEKESRFQTLVVDDAQPGDATFAVGASNNASVLYLNDRQDFYGRDVTVLVPVDGTARSATWTFGPLEAGVYTVSLPSLTVVAGGQSTNVEILDASMNSLGSVPLSQFQSSPSFSTIEGELKMDWKKFTTVDVGAGGTLSVRIRTLSQTGIVVADAVRIDREVSTSYVYDKNGNLISDTNTRGYATSYEYDELGRQVLLKTPDPDIVGSGNLPLETRSIYDGYGNAIQTVENRGTVATADDRTNAFRFDRRNRLTEKVLNVNSGTDSDDNVTTAYEYDAVGNLTKEVDAEGNVSSYRYDDANQRIVEYSDFGEGRDSATEIDFTESPVGAYGLDGSELPTSATFPDANSIHLSGNAWKKVDINYTLRHNSVLEFEFEGTLESDYHLIGFDTDNAFTAEDLPRFFELGGKMSAPNVFHAEFRREILPNGKTLVHIPVGQFLTPAEKVNGLAVTRLVFVNWEFSAGLDPADRGQSTFSNIRVYDSDEVRAVTTYDAQGNVETIREASDPRNITTLYRYDRLRRLVAERIDYGGVQQHATDYKYDNVFQLTSVANYIVGNETRSTTYEYDRLGRRIKTTLPDADGNSNTLNDLVTTFTYDTAGNLIAEKNGENEIVRTSYDARGNVITETDGNGDETRYRYDSEGNLITVTDAEQNVTRYKYDGLNRVTEATNAFGTRYHRYDAAGQLERIIDRNEVSGTTSTTPYRTRSFTYDALGRKLQETWRNGSGAGSVTVSQQTWSYDRLNRVTKEVDGNGSYTNLADDVVGTYVYDGLGRLVVERNFDPATISTQGHLSGVPRVKQAYEYSFQVPAGSAGFSDLVGRTQYLVTSTTETPVASIVSEYDRVGRLASFTDQDGSTSLGPAVERKHLKFSYDALDNLRTIERRGNYVAATNTWQNTLVSQLNYDKADRLGAITHDVNLGATATDIVHSYAYDNASRVKQFNTTAGTADLREYAYDDAGQLNSRLNGFGTPVESYGYDDNGNRIAVGSQTVVTGLGNRVTNDGTYAYTYDGEGNLIRRTPSASVSETNPVIRYAYDHRNRLTTVTSYATTAHADAGTNSIQVISYTYDAQGRRVKRAFDANGGTPSFVNETFVYEGDALAMRFGNVGEITHRHLHGPTGETLVDEVFNASGQSTEVLWLLGDHQGTPRDIVNQSGALRKHIDYNSFGQITGEQTSNGAAIELLFGFTGQERDTATGLQLHGERWYDPRTGRWLSDDPLGFDGGDANLYRYVGNSPLNFIDPTGTTLNANPFNDINIYAGGFSGGKVAAYRPTSMAIASGIKAVGNSVLSAGIGLVNSVYSAGTNLANNFGEISSLYSQANVLTTQINALADRRAERGFLDSWFGPSDSALHWQQSELVSQRLAVNSTIQNIISTSIFGGPRTEIVSNPGATEYVSYASAVGSGLKTGGKAVGNSAASSLSLGFYDGPFTVTQQDIHNGYDTSRLIAGVSTELLVGVGTGGLATYSKAGSAARYISKGALAFDTAGNVVNVGRGVNDAYNNGLKLSNSVQIIGSGLGLGGNVAAGGRALQEIASDVGRLRVQPAGLYGGVPIAKVSLAEKKASAAYEQLVTEAQLKYPNKAGRIENHHIDPRYLGGPTKGATVPLDAAYHQVITNKFREVHAYGLGPVSSAQRQTILNKVYSQLPLPRGPKS